MRCAAITRAGARCRLDATHGSYCYQHSPETAEERRRRARKGGRTGGNGRRGTELRDVNALCEDLTERVLAGDLLPGPAAVANQLINTRLRAIEQERKNKETEDLEVRIDALERQQGAGRERRWG
jgi:hypothetical protein